MPEKVLNELRKFIDFLDGVMEETPSQEVADLSNHLETVYQEHDN